MVHDVTDNFDNLGQFPGSSIIILRARLVDVKLKFECKVSLNNSQYCVDTARIQFQGECVEELKQVSTVWETKFLEHSHENRCSYMFYTKFHSPRPIFYSPSSKCTLTGERASVSFLHCSKKRDITLVCLWILSQRRMKNMFWCHAIILTKQMLTCYQMDPWE